MLNQLGLRQLIVIVACVGLAACGFRLAGTSDLPDELSTIHLVTNNFNKQQQDELSGRLTRAGANVVSEPTADAVLLSVNLNIIPDRRLASAGSSGRFVVRIARSLDYSLKSSAGEVIVPSKTLRRQNDSELDDDSLLASNREKENVGKDLEQALFEQLVNQLRLINFGS
jgi:LPS-assembly lipoprotein